MSAKKTRAVFLSPLLALAACTPEGYPSTDSEMWGVVSVFLGLFVLVGFMFWSGTPMSELIWPLGVVIVLGLAMQFGGLAVFVILGVMGIFPFKALGGA